MSLRRIIEDSGGRIELIDATPRNLHGGNEPMKYANLNEVVDANDAAGQHWFDDETMLFFKSRIESDLIDGQFFITSEQSPDGPRAYTIRAANDDGHIVTMGDFGQYVTLEAAKTMLEAGRTG